MANVSMYMILFTQSNEFPEPIDDLIPSSLPPGCHLQYLSLRQCVHRSSTGRETGPCPAHLLSGVPSHRADEHSGRIPYSDNTDYKQCDRAV